MATSTANPIIPEGVDGGIEFRLGRPDHKVAEDFLAQDPTAVDGIWVDAQNARIQKGAIEAAKRAGVEMLIEPQTERLVVHGFAPSGPSYATGGSS